MDLTQKSLKQHILYDEHTGEFTWLKSLSNNIKVGMPAGCYSHNYRVITIFGKNYRATHLAYLYMTGALPDGIIDHMNMNPRDNRWCNLRLTTVQGNSQNLQYPHKDSKSGFLGVTPYRSKFVAQIYANGKRLYLGVFATAEAAHNEYIRVKKILHPGYKEAV